MPAQALLAQAASAAGSACCVAGARSGGNTVRCRSLLAAPSPRCCRLSSSGRSGSSMLGRLSSAAGGGISGGSAGRRVRADGYVGEGTRPAGEYYAADFDWEELVADGEAAVERQQREMQQHRELQQQETGEVPPDSSVGCSGGEAPEEDGEGGDGPAWSDGGSWEQFHAQHSAARFFKEKRYLILEFPALAVQHPPQHIAEIGCGCGSALLPVLKANPTCRVTGCDISPTALQLFLSAAQRAGVEEGRIHTFVLDAAVEGADGSSNSSSGNGASSSVSQIEAGSSSSGGSHSSRPSPLAGLEADSLLIVFTLSALLPEDQPALMAHAYAALKPGGLLLFRDYGLYDMAQLRFPGSQMLGHSLYRRSEGTLAYFFSTQALEALAASSGFEVVECEYARVEVRNRKSGAAMRRVFVHGVLRKPLDATS